MLSSLFPKTSNIHFYLKPIDVLAGLSVASLLLPQAVAYAFIAHMSIQAAIGASLVGLLLYAIFGASRFAIVSPTSSSAALVAAGALSLMPSGSEEQAALSFALVILTGCGLIIVAFARLGRLSAFVSRPVLRGFSFALAATIIIKQFPIMVGTHATGANPFTLLADLFEKMPQWSWWSLAAGTAALLLLISLKRYTKLPAAFIVLALGIGLAYACDLSVFQIAIVGPFELAIPHFGLPKLSLHQWLSAGELAGGLLVIIFSESWGSIRTLALQHGNHVEPNRELFALGAANLASGLIQGMPVGAGFSACVANEAAGAQSKWAGIAAAICMLFLVVYGKPLIEHIPEPILAATVIGALLHSLNPQPIIALWRMNRDQYLTLAAIAAVLFFGILHGMIIAVALSIASAIRTFSQPAVRELAELDSTRNYIDCGHHPEAMPHKNILILRPEEPLFFASVDGVFDVIKALVKSRVNCRIIIVSLEESSDLDSSATESLIELSHNLAKLGITLLLARVKDPIRLLLLKTAPDSFQDKLFWSVADAADHAKQLLPTMPI
ncbi:SulP family inorganic anion transporter [Solimicrobium silvestre]|uniref:Sulfate permease and related transporters (MFS superfamily) n=1 Tax=Solimicrobium silvestre TaxID=2099400 RepID=A0A2S9GVV1_9BURK|nr:SulP family inorganic anion transporter [Solimicrobium silvestre]PRC91855.1 Sulfate permease and related transporters (MFS superfamily) [Solimicrobium silvestre]